MRYRVDIVAPSVVEVVRNLGGWVVDQVMAGWEVTVLLTDDDDMRALQILGANAFDLSSAVRRWEQRPGPQRMMVADRLFVSHAGVREAVINTLGQGHAEVMIWDGNRDEMRSGTVHSVNYELSSAARAFKAHAMVATGDNARIEPTEVFRRAETTCSLVVPRWLRSADLGPPSPLIRVCDEESVEQ